jgi:hypothetical protein
VTVQSGTQVVITGRYPAARYFSFTLYGSTGQPLDSVYDKQIAPDKGSANPSAARCPAERPTTTA